MQILLACAKDMATVNGGAAHGESMPLFEAEARKIALQMMEYDVEELQEMMKINRRLASLNYLRYHSFMEPEPKAAAVLSYTGMAYRHLDAATLNKKQLDFAQRHLWITSFLYGLLRPLDSIKNYRLEGYVRLPGNNDMRMFDYWKPLLTDVLIDSVKADGGVLLNVASEEMKGLFDWKRVKEEVRSIEPEFVVQKGGKLKTVVVYAKMCRGAMARFVIDNAIGNADDIKAFEYQEFRYCAQESSDDKPVFILASSQQR
ncbi:MAG: YaaA family protein [Prevotellaceae bacterium]|nr:YaaA family protein [Prevotella sp.]MDD7258289.1 YaaA family protein [Prevotellaceae bacterium]MDY6129958.1 YaaA family protein [Prevotella sp.]